MSQFGLGKLLHMMTTLTSGISSWEKWYLSSDSMLFLIASMPIISSLRFLISSFPSVEILSLVRVGDMV